MSDAVESIPGALRRLERDLVRRRLRGVDRRLAIEIVLLVLVGWAFLFWQSSNALADLGRTHGPAGVATAIVSAWGVIALTVGALASAAMTRSLLLGAPGPAWLSLPIPVRLVLRHVAWDARLRGLWPALLAPPVLAASVGRVPPWWIAMLAALLMWLVIESGRIGTALAWRLALRSVEERPVAPLLRLLGAATRAPRAGGRPPARWRGGPSWLALWHQDAKLCACSPAVRRRLLAVAVTAMLSAAVWALPIEPGLGRLLALALALVSAAAIGEWLIALSAEEPFALLRAQPVGVSVVWRARATWAAAGAAMLGVLQWVSAGGLPPHARQLLAFWVAGAALVIALIAVHYALTLYPRADRAARMLSLTLGIAVAGSLMIPLAGWVILLTALLHSARRLPRWARLEPAP